MNEKRVIRDFNQFGLAFFLSPQGINQWHCIRNFHSFLGEFLAVVLKVRDKKINKKLSEAAEQHQ